MWSIERKSPTPVDWSEFHVWCYLLTDVNKHNKAKSCLVSEHIPCSTYVASRGIIRERLLECVEIFKHRDTKMVTTQQSPADTVYTQFVAGAVGGMAATYSTHWLDTVKVRMQTFPGTYNGGVHCLKAVFQDSGITGLYKGAGPAVVGHACKAAFVFMSYGICQDLIRALSGYSRDDHMHVWQHASAGALTGISASLFMCPLELIKCRMQALHQVCGTTAGPSYGINTRQYSKTMPTLLMMREIFRMEGIRGLYRGLMGMWVKEIPGSFIYFGSYHMARSLLQYLQEKEHLGSVKVFSCGVFAGLCYCATHPLESVKTRVQVMSAMSESRGFLNTFRHVVRHEGILPLYSGMKTQMLRSGIFSGIQFLVYESTKTLIIMRQDKTTYDDV